MMLASAMRAGPALLALFAAVGCGGPARTESAVLCQGAITREAGAGGADAKSIVRLEVFERRGPMPTTPGPDGPRTLTILLRRDRPPMNADLDAFFGIIDDPTARPVRLTWPADLQWGAAFLAAYRIRNGGLTPEQAITDFVGPPNKRLGVPQLTAYIRNLPEIMSDLGLPPVGRSVEEETIAQAE